MSVEPRDDSDESWHDNLIYALHLRAPEPEAGNWRSELILDIDHIVQWICPPNGKTHFLVAPTTLVFHDVIDLSIRLDMSGDAVALALNELSIDRVSRSPAPRAGRDQTLPYDRWTIALNLPRSGEIAFGASGFSQTPRAEPILVDEPRRPPSKRAGLLCVHDRPV